MQTGGLTGASGDGAGRSVLICKLHKYSYLQLLNRPSSFFSKFEVFSQLIFHLTIEQTNKYRAAGTWDARLAELDCDVL